MDHEEYLPKSEETVAVYEQWDKKMKSKIVVGRSESRVFIFEDGKHEVRFTEGTHFKSLKFTKEKTFFSTKIIIGIIFAALGVVLLLAIGFYRNEWWNGYYWQTYISPGPGLFFGPVFMIIGVILILVGIFRKGGARLIANLAGTSVTFFNKSPIQIEKMKEFVQKGLPTLF